MPGHLGAVSLKKSHDIVILSFCNIVKGQANSDISGLIISKNLPLLELFLSTVLLIVQ